MISIKFVYIWDITSRNLRHVLHTTSLRIYGCSGLRWIHIEREVQENVCSPADSHRLVTITVTLDIAARSELGDFGHSSLSLPYSSQEFINCASIYIQNTRQQPGRGVGLVRILQDLRLSGTQLVSSMPR